MQNEKLRMERDRFVKLLGLTSSSSDAEALAAIRKCNDMLIQHKLSWHDVVQWRCLGQARSETSVSGEPDRVDRERTRNSRPSPSRAFEASIRREEYLEQALRNEKAATMRVYIGNVPLLLRLLFFPLWAGAEMVGSIVIPEASVPMRAMKLLVVVLVIAACSAVWLQIIHGVGAML
jgi:hypothetical protein